MSEAAFFICATILIILFAGDPDLMDRLIGHFDPSCKPAVVMEARP